MSEEDDFSSDPGAHTSHRNPLVFIPATEENKEALSVAAFGITKEEALRQGICVQCRQEALPKCHSDAGRREYRISGMCEMCFDEMFGGE
jgi:hypothetical protein